MRLVFDYEAMLLAERKDLEKVLLPKYAASRVDNFRLVVAQILQAVLEYVSLDFQKFL